MLIGEDGANLVARATPIAYIARGKFWVNNHAHVIAPNGSADLRFLEFFVEHLDLTPYLSGSAQPKLNRSNLDRITVPVPPAHLQKKFGEVLSALDDMREEQQRSARQLDRLFNSLQHRAFLGELTAGEASKAA